MDIQVNSSLSLHAPPTFLSIFLLSLNFYLSLVLLLSLLHLSLKSAFTPILPPKLTQPLHLAADVNIYASSPHHAKHLIGNHENTEIGEFIRDYLALDLRTITRHLLERGAVLDAPPSSSSWMGESVADERTLTHADHYHGDFKRSLECGCGH